MADIILSVAAELDPSSLRRIRAQIEEATKGKPVQVTVGLDTKSAKAISAALTAALSTKAIPISVTVDQKSLNQAVKTTTAAFSQILSALGTAASQGAKPGSSGGQGAPASGNSINALNAAQVKAAAQNFAQAQMTARTTLVTQTQQTNQVAAQQAAQTLAQQKAQAAATLQQQTAASNAQLAQQKAAAAQAQVAAKANATVQAATVRANANVQVSANQANAAITVAQTRAQTAAAAQALRQQQMQNAAVNRQTQGAMIKRYQQAAQMYQLGNIADKLQIPYAGQVATQIGSTLQAFPTAPYGRTVALGLGIGAVTAGFEFTRNSLKSYGEVETQLTRIRNLTDSTDADIAKFTQDIAGLSKATGRGQAEIAEGLYFIASSGYKGSDAMKILQASTMSSVAGMGDAKTMADVLTSAMNSYGIKAEDAFKVTDKFIAAVREGKAEPEALAKSLGAVMPFAREAGVSLEELLGAVSAVTLQTGNAATAGTSIKQAIVSMYAPSKEATAQLDLYYGEGKGASTIQKKLSTQGLSAALEELYTKSDGSIAELDRIFGNVRALAGVFQLSTNKFQNFNEITKKIIDAKDLTMEGYQRGFETWEVQLDMFKQGAEAFKIGFGAFMKPFATGFFHIFGTGLKATGDALAASAVGGVPAGFNSLANSGAGIAAENKGRTPSFLESLISGISPVAKLVSAPNEAAKLAYAIQKIQENAALAQANNEWRMTPAGYRMVPKAATGNVSTGPMPPITYPSVMTPEYADFLATQAATPKGQKGLASPASWPGQSSFAKRGVFDAAFPGKPTPTLTDKLADRDKAVADLVRATEIRKEAVAAAAKLNDEIAGGLAASIEGLVNQSQKYDDFFGKYNDIVKKIKDTPDTYQVVTEKGKAVSAKALAAEDAKIQQLALSVKIDEISNKIRAATIAKAKTPETKSLAGLRDEAADLKAAARAQEYADLQAGVKSRGTVTYQNPEEKKALDEQRKALQDYNRGTFDTFTGTFTDMLKGSTKDLPTFNALLKEGGTLMGAFADAAGLLNTSGFVTSLGEAALQAKYLRDNLGAPLKGDALVKGLGDYGVALQEFKTKMLGLSPFLSGEEPVTMDIAVKYNLVDTSSSNWSPTGFKTPYAGGSGWAKSAKDQLADLNKKGGLQDAIFKDLGVGGTGNALEAAINLQVKLTAGNYNEDFVVIRDSLQTAANLAENAIKVKVRLETAGANFWAGKSDEKKSIEDVIGPDMGGNGDAWTQKFKESPIPDVTIPQIKVKVDSVDTKTAQIEIEKQVGAIKPLPVIVTEVDISKPAITGEDKFREMITTTMQAIASGFTFNIGDIEWTSHYKGGNPKPDGAERPPGGAIGGDVTASGAIDVGEVGRERVWLPKGAHIFTASETTRMGSLNAGASVETWRGGGQRSYGPSSYTNTTIKVDARGAAEPVRTREQVVKGVSAALSVRAARRRAREIGEI